MRKVHVLALLAFWFLVTNCVTPHKTPLGVFVDTKRLNGRSFHKLFIEVETVDVQLRAMLETDLVEALNSGGYAAVKSIDAIPFSLKELKLPTEEQIKQKVNEAGCDAILFVSISSKRETLEYNPGTTTKENKQIGASLLAGVLNRNSANINTIQSGNTPGSYNRSGGGYFLQSNLYDVPAEELMFSVLSQPIDLSATDKAGKAYAADVIAQLKNEKLLNGTSR